jgi:gliding motility-associated-like protein
MKKLVLNFILLIITCHFVYSQGDDCLNATQITNVSNYCSGNAFYTNLNSTASAFAQATCITGAATEDVWFSFTAIGTDILLSASGIGAGGTMNRPRIAIYSGNCATTINQLGCANGTAGSGVTQLYQSALSPGTVYYIRISTLTNNEGTFELCLNNYTPVSNAGADCGGAAYLCSNNPVSVGVLSGGGQDTDEPESSSCMEVPGADEGNSSWFTFTCGTAGVLTFDIIPVNQNDDIDFMVFQLSGTNPCDPRTVIRCNASAFLNPNGAVGLNSTDTDISEMPGFNPGNNSYCQSVNMTVGTSYAILVNNFSTSGGFTLSFGTGTGAGVFSGPNPVISTSSTTICAGQSVTFDALNSTNVSASGYNWNFNNGGSPTSATGIGPHTVTYANQGVYTAILNGSNTAGCSDVSFVTINVVSPILPTFNQISPICAGGTFILPNTSNNGISGTWSPIIDNTTTTTYLFTPDVNQCANPTVMTVVVIPEHTISQGVDITSCVNLAIPNISISFGGSATGILITGLPTGVTSQVTGSAVVISGASSVIGSYPYTATTTGNNCSSVTTTGIITITNSINPIFNPLGPFCQDDIGAPLPLVSTNNPGITGTWIPATINTNNVGVQTYSFNPDPNQCASLTTIDIEITPLITPTFPNFGPYCLNEVVNPSNLPISSNENILGTWNPSSISTLIAGNIAHIFTPDINQCSDQASLTIIVSDPISPSFSQLGPYTQNGLAGSLPNLSNDIPGISGTWSPNVIATDAIGQLTYTFLPDANSCAIPVTMDVIIQDETVFYIPNTFTPDQDEHNQLWGPVFTQGFDSYNFEIEIYNRWGELLWLSYNANARWDGTYGLNGRDVQEGVYSYKITYKIKEVDKRLVVTGHVNLIR